MTESHLRSDANELFNNGLIRTWELEVVGYKNHFFIKFMQFQEMCSALAGL